MQQLFGPDSRKIKGHYALAGTGVTLYKVLSLMASATNLTVCCRCHKCRSVKERLEKCCHTQNATNVCNNCTAFETSAYYFLV